MIVTILVAVLSCVLVWLCASLLDVSDDLDI